jgi:hypothetical protein
MAKIIKREKTKYPGIQLFTYESGTKAFNVGASHNGKQKPVRLRTPPNTIEDAKSWLFKWSDKLRRNKSYDDSLFEKTKVSHTMEVYLNGGTINGRTVAGGVSYRNYLNPKPFGTTDRRYINDFIDWLNKGNDAPIGAFNTDAANDYIDALVSRKWGGPEREDGRGKRNCDPRTITLATVRRRISPIQLCGRWLGVDGDLRI